MRLIAIALLLAACGELPPEPEPDAGFCRAWESRGDALPIPWPYEF